MVTVETKVQQAIKEILIKEINKHIEAGDNFDVVLSIASLIDSYEEEPDPCEPCKETCDSVGITILRKETWFKTILLDNQAIQLNL